LTVSGNVKFSGGKLLFIVCLLWHFVGYSYTRKYTKSGFSYLYASPLQENIAPEEKPATGLPLVL